MDGRPEKQILAKQLFTHAVGEPERAAAWVRMITEGFAFGQSTGGCLQAAIHEAMQNILHGSQIQHILVCISYTSTTLHESGFFLIERPATASHTNEDPSLSADRMIEVVLYGMDCGSLIH